MFSENIKRFRKMQGFTQKNLADMLKVCRSTVSAWENAVSEPDIKTIIKIKKIFDITYEDLLED